MRSAFREQIGALGTGLAGLCDLSGRAMQHATHALLNADLTVAEEVLGRHDELTYRCAQVETDAFTILALQAPVAGDLRAVLSALKNVADAERMGVLALHMAQIARRRHPCPAVPDEVSGHVADMGRIAARIGNDIPQVVLTNDSDKAAQLALDDEAMDDLHRHLFTVVMNPEWPHGTAAAVDITLLSRYFERFADHAVDIAGRVIYQSTGAHA
ncbi:phosphate signaling complex protein PhoU [Mycolicibacterium fluoranthenivorans]|uniref:Phosphate-specific transport system accessory protein PhoU n=1 Tax=Mycolicibacterium fluoranthenivorans TaxID=258505 RepID=A0A1G4WZE7_9MYCO|nr:phosphate signaling complex protein PhoU [Mycolicibacterium fluoranthenivorans]SCX32799.1 phosphate transport system protein [Mycolicibacterium fluoranthenivorans]